MHNGILMAYFQLTELQKKFKNLAATGESTNRAHYKYLDNIIEDELSKNK